jgi:glycosyltransferase involved in cell wall biosynthesis
MKTLFIVAKGVYRQSADKLRELEQENRYPRKFMLEKMLSADILSERWLAEDVPAFRRWIYKILPFNISQIIEVLIIHRKYDAIFSYAGKMGPMLALMMKYLGIKKPHIIAVTRITSLNKRKTRQKMWLLAHAKDSITRLIMWSSVQRKIAVQQLDIPPRKIKFVKRGTDQNFWKPQPAKTDIICSAGMEMRDYPTLVEALQPLDIPCHIATGEARGKIFKTVKNLYRIDSLPGNITVEQKNYEELRKLYARSRFVVVSLLPTDTDNGITVILEAMAMGKPVICSRVEGQVDVIREGETGLFVPQGDPAAMREAILELWNDPARVETMGRKARKYVEKHHNLEQFTEAIQQVVCNGCRQAGSTNSKNKDTKIKQEISSGS